MLLRGGGFIPLPDHRLLRMERSDDQDRTCSSSVDSCSNLPPPDSCFDDCAGYNNHNNDNGDGEDCGSRKSDLSTDLKLGLAVMSSPDDGSDSKQREKRSDWPPIKLLLRSTLDVKSSYNTDKTSLFVKVHMEGIPIGRKLDLYTFDGYDALLTSLFHMFKTFVFCGEDADGVHSGKHHVLTYQDREGDWMMVGDIPWEMFLSTVTRLKITRAHRC